MLWLAAHMWMLLFAAFAIGLGVGWWIWGARAPVAASLGEEAPLGTLASDHEVALDAEDEESAT